MKILIYGDSNLWGYQKIPKEYRVTPYAKIRRLDEDERWSGIFATTFGKRHPNSCSLSMELTRELLVMMIEAMLLTAAPTFQNYSKLTLLTIL